MAKILPLPKNVILSYLNINSIRNKFENLREIVKQNVDVLAVGETKIDTSFPSAQFFLEGYHSPYRPDISRKSGGLLVYVKTTIPSRQLSLPKFQFRTQALPFDLNLRNEKWLVISIYRPPLDSLARFLEFLASITDIFSSAYDNFIIMGDFNAQPLDIVMKNFTRVNGLINIIEENTCFKGQSSCIDLILTSRRFSFKHSNFDKTGISDCHHSIYSKLKSNLSNSEPELVTYRDYKKFSFENFKTSLDNALRHCSNDYKDFEYIFTSVLNGYAPKKQKLLGVIINLN